MAAALERRVQEHAQDLGGERERRGPAPSARTFRSLCSRDRRAAVVSPMAGGADARHLVRRDGHADAAAAHQHARSKRPSLRRAPPPRRSPGSHRRQARWCRGPRRPRPGVELGLQRVLQVHAGVVGAQGDSHARILNRPRAYAPSPATMAPWPKAPPRPAVPRIAWRVSADVSVTSSQSPLDVSRLRRSAP